MIPLELTKKTIYPGDIWITRASLCNLRIFALSTS
jgi:hypothetical protein